MQTTHSTERLRSAAKARAVRTSSVIEPGCESDEPRFIGWHESSLDLQRGLAVTEHGGLDDGGAVRTSGTRWFV